MKKDSAYFKWFKWHVWPIPKDFPILSIYEVIAYAIFLVLCIVLYFDIQKVPVFRNHVTYDCIYKSPEDSLKNLIGSLHYRIPMSYTYSDEDGKGYLNLWSCLNESGSKWRYPLPLKKDSLLDALLSNIPEKISKDDLPTLVYIKVWDSSDFINYGSNEKWSHSCDAREDRLSYTNYHKVNNGVVFESYSGSENGLLLYKLEDAAKELSYSRPTWYRLYDISQMYFELQFHSSYLETIQVDFVGATEFSKMWPEPDKITMSSIIYHDREKIRQILLGGLKFHAKFIELDKVQSARLFFMSALCSALLAIFIAFIIMGIYKTISNMVKGTKNKKDERKQNEEELQEKPHNEPEEITCKSTNNP